MTAELIYRKVSADGHHIFECGKCHTIFVGASPFCKQCGAEFVPDGINWKPKKAPDMVNVTRCENCHYNTTESYKNEASNALWSDGGKKVYCSKNRRWRIKNGYCDEGYEDGKIDG